VNHSNRQKKKKKQEPAFMGDYAFAIQLGSAATAAPETKRWRIFRRSSQ
jgi:hypothetical protein